MNRRPTKRPDAPRGPFKSLRSGLARIVNGKPFLVVLSIIIAIAAWGALVASDGSLLLHKTLTDVGVSVTGESALKSRGYIVMEDIKTLVPSIRMTIEVSQQNYSKASGTAYNPHFDLSKISSTGENELEIGFSSQFYGQVLACEPSSVKVNVERYITRRVPVVIEMTGETPSGIHLDSTRTDPSMLSVSGPQSLVTKVSRAVVTLDRSKLSAQRMGDRMSLVLQLQDSAGKQVVSDLLEVTNQTVITESVVVDVELVPVKDVPLKIEGFVTGKPEEGYELTEILLGEQALAVAARQEVLDALEFITTDAPLSIEGANQSVNGQVRIRKPNGARNTLPAEISVTAKIEEKTIDRTIRSVPIEIDDLSGELQATLDSRQTTVQLTGAYGFINELDAKDIRLFVDAGGLGEGEHVLPVQIHIDNAEEFSCALSRPEVVVKIQAQ